MKHKGEVPLPDAILFQAIETFVERGYEKASMDEVAARAGTTKRTVYAHHGNKEELFRSALARAVEHFLADLPPLVNTGEPAAELERFALQFSQLCTWQGAVRLQRVVMAEAERFPDLAEMLHREVVERSERIVADYLDRLAPARRAGKAAGSDERSIAIASMFLNMTTGRQRFATLLQAREPHPQHPGWGTMPDHDRTHIRHAVRLFLAGLDGTATERPGLGTDRQRP
jgi:AcrR family transcriptional regulator